MSKLALVALVFVAVVAISEVSAYKTTITTSIIEDNYYEEYTHDRLDNGITPSLDSLENGRGSPKECRRQIPIQQVNHCQMHLTEGIIFDDKLKMVVDNKQKQQQHLQLCCNQLKKVDQQCQCDAIQVVFDEARQQGDVMESRQMLRKAQNLPNDCKLQVQECPLVSPRA